MKNSSFNALVSLKPTGILFLILIGLQASAQKKETLAYRYYKYIFQSQDINMANDHDEYQPIEYYKSIFPEENGKIKSIGGTPITYYRSIFPEENGKLKSIGDITFEYYRSIFPEENGKFKNIGNTEITYYRSIFPEENGKIKSIGGAEISYNRSILPQENGKVKSIIGKTASNFIASPTKFYYFILFANDQ